MSASPLTGASDVDAAGGAGACSGCGAVCVSAILLGSLLALLERVDDEDGGEVSLRREVEAVVLSTRARVAPVEKLTSSAVLQTLLHSLSAVRRAPGGVVSSHDLSALRRLLSSQLHRLNTSSSGLASF